jgi:type I restriction enzyme R subunit
MSNFSFLQQNLPLLFDNAKGAEKYAKTDPRAACTYARITLETAVQWMYDHDDELRRPYESHLNALLKEGCFRDMVPPHIMQSMEMVRKAGNKAVHETRKLPAVTSLFAVKNLHSFLFWIYRCYFDSHFSARFDEAMLPAGTSRDSSRKKITQLEEKLQNTLKEAQEKENVQREKEVYLEGVIEELKAQMTQNKAAAFRIPDTYDYNEAETRHYLIDMLLEEMGWDCAASSENVVQEMELDGVKRNKSRSGKGYADYVLMGDNGLPLAVIEAKRTGVDAEEGRYQALDYADALEKKFGQRPVIFYTNGYEHFIWDDNFYGAREIQAFYKK